MDVSKGMNVHTKCTLDQSLCLCSSHIVSSLDFLSSLGRTCLGRETFYRKLLPGAVIFFSPRASLSESASAFVEEGVGIFREGCQDERESRLASPPPLPPPPLPTFGLVAISVLGRGRRRRHRRRLQLTSTPGLLLLSVVLRHQFRHDSRQ